MTKLQMQNCGITCWLREFPGGITKILIKNRKRYIEVAQIKIKIPKITCFKQRSQAVSKTKWFYKIFSQFPMWRNTIFPLAMQVQVMSTRSKMEAIQKIKQVRKSVRPWFKILVSDHLKAKCRNKGRFKREVRQFRSWWNKILLWNRLKLCF